MIGHHRGNTIDVAVLHTARRGHQIPFLFLTLVLVLYSLLKPFLPQSPPLISPWPTTHLTGSTSGSVANTGLERRLVPVHLVSPVLMRHFLGHSYSFRGHLPWDKYHLRRRGCDQARVCQSEAPATRIRVKGLQDARRRCWCSLCEVVRDRVRLQCHGHGPIGSFS